MKVSGFILHTSPYHMTHSESWPILNLSNLKVTEPWPGAHQPSWCYLEIDRSSSALPADRSGRFFCDGKYPIFQLEGQVEPDITCHLPTILCQSMAQWIIPCILELQSPAVIEMWTWPLYPRKMSILESWKMENGNNINKYKVSYNSNIAIYHKPFM